MLSYLRIINFRSIVDLTLDLSFAEKKAPNGYADMEILPFITSQSGERLVPCLALYGANASGKSNIIRAVSTFLDIVANGIDGNHDPNRLNSSSSETGFEAAFFKDGRAYVFSITYDGISIKQEELAIREYSTSTTIYTIINDKTDFSKIATNVYSVQKLKEVFTVECCDTKKKQKYTFLSKITRGFAGLNDDITIAFQRITGSCLVLPNNHSLFSTGVDTLIGTNPHETLASATHRITEIIKKLDIDIEDIQLKRSKETSMKSVLELFKQATDPDPTYSKPVGSDTFVSDRITSLHTASDGSPVWFNFKEESEGTQRVAGLIGHLLAALDSGSVVFVDELDCSLHSLLLIELVRLFKDKRYNKTGAQIVFTAHNTDLLDSDFMRKSEVGMVMKTPRKGTEIRRLSDFSSVRNVTNFRKQYLEGLYSGIPFPYI